MWNHFLFKLVAFGALALSFFLRADFIYETYLESWDPKWQIALEGMPPVAANSSNSYEGVVLDIAFAEYKFPGLNGVQFSDMPNDVQTVVSYVQDRGGKVKISYGGASSALGTYYISATVGWPSNIATLANNIKAVVNDHNFDGVDFDIEDPQPSQYSAATFAQQLFNFLTAVRAQLPNKIITATIPGQAWGTYWELLAQQLANDPNHPKAVDSINFMEYDLWIGSSTLEEQVLADLQTYTGATNTIPGSNGTPGWGIPANRIQLGLMPGNDDRSQFLSVSNAGFLTSHAVSLGLVGVMTWDLNRDSGTNPIPSLEGAAPYAYSEAIRSALPSRP
ncbi:MAG: glycoside hydrolase family 18 protein [Chlamydiota bacterium]